MKNLLLFVLVLFSLTAHAQITVLGGGGAVGGGGVGGGGGGGGGAGSIDPWAPATAYALDDIAIYNETVFVRIIAGTTATAPDQDVTNWAPVGPNFLSQWGAGNYYHVGNVVEYSGKLYRRLVAGISAGNPAGDAVNWSPLSVDLADVTGILAQANGGLGFDATTVTDGQLLIGDTGTGFVSASLTGTVNQVNVANGAGSITLSTPQDIHSGASPTFVSATFSGVLANEFLKTDGASGLTSVASIDLTADVGSSVLPIANGGTNSSTALVNDRIMYSSGGSIVEAPALADGELLIGQSGGAPVSGSITGTVNQVAVTNGAGSITLSTPQDIHSGASPTFVSATFSGALPNEFLKTDGASGLTTVSSIDLTSDVGTSVLPIANGGTNSATALNNDRMVLTSGGAIVEGGALSDGQFFIGATGGSPLPGTVAGTANQVNAVYASNSITLSLPQDVHTGATPTFASASLGNIDVGSNYVSATDVGGGIDLNPSAPGVVTVNGDLTVTGTLSGTIGGFTADSALRTDASGDIEEVALADGQMLIGQTGAGPVAANLTGTLNQVDIANASGSVTFSLPQDIHAGASPTFVSATFSGALPNEFLKTDGASGLTTTSVVDLTTDVGATVLPIANGGTNSATALTNGQLMTSVGGAIVELGAMSTGDFVVASGSAPAVVTMSGDATVDALGAITLSDDAVSKGLYARIGTPTFQTIQHGRDINQSAGLISGGVITDSGSGEIDVSSGTVSIRATDSETAELLFSDFPSVTNLTLADGIVNNYIYVEYNAGSPQVVATGVKRLDTNTNVLIGVVGRNGTALHIADYTDDYITDSASILSRFHRETRPFAMSLSNKAITSETGTRNIGITSGSFWQGLNLIQTSAFDSSVADTFTYYYRNGSGGWTRVTGQTQISNSNYDDGDGTLGVLLSDRYTSNYVYIAQDSSVHILYGRIEDKNLGVVQAEEPYVDLPPELSLEGYARLIAKVIINGADSFITQIDVITSVEDTASFSPTAHSDLTNLTTNDDHTQYLFLNGRAGGQTARGGTAASENLTLDSTSNATKGNIILNGSGGKVAVGTTTPHASSVVDITSITKGFLPPRMTQAQRDAITTPATGLMIFNTDINQPEYYNGTAWVSY